MFKIPLFKIVFAVALLACAALASFTVRAAPGMLTLLEGEALVMHGKGSIAAAEGLRLPPAALLQTSGNAKLVRIEWADGSALDLGPGAQVVLLGEKISDKHPKAPGIYLLRGWGKLSAATAGSAPVMLFGAAEVAPFAGALVVGATAEQLSMFVESGAPSLQERGAKAAVALAAGQYWSRSGNQKSDVQPRPPADLLPKLPRAFRDTLPRRWAALQSREVPGKALAPPNYAEIRDWLVGDVALRRLLVTHFAVWAQDPGIRSGLQTHINDHREWAPLVAPKPDAAPASTPRTPS